MPNRYNILHLEINGKEIEREPIPEDKDVKQLVEQFKTAYNLHNNGKEYVFYYYAESKMNKNEADIS